MPISKSVRPCSQPAASHSPKPESNDSQSAGTPNSSDQSNAADIEQVLQRVLRFLQDAERLIAQFDEGEVPHSLLSLPGVSVDGCSMGTSKPTTARTRRSPEMVPDKTNPIGVISPEELYTLKAFKHRLGIREATLRAARRSGLKVHYAHKQAYVYGRDWIEYVLNSPSPRGIAAAATTL